MSFCYKTQEVLREERGQSSVEAMLVLAVLLVICVGCWVFFSAATDGRLQKHHVEAAAHTLDFHAAEGVQDVLLY